MRSVLAIKASGVRVKLEMDIGELVERKVEGVGGRCFRSPYQQTTPSSNPPSNAEISPVLTPPGSVTSLTYKQPFYNK